MSPQFLSCFFKMTVSIFTLYILISFTLLTDMPVASCQTLYIKTDKTLAKSYLLLLNGFLILHFPSFLHEPHAAGQILLLTKIGNWKTLHYPFPFQRSSLQPQRKGLWLLLWAKLRPFLSQSSCFLWVRALSYHPWFLFFSWVPVHQVSEVGWCCMSTWFSFKQESPWPGLLYFCIFQNGPIS